METGIPTIIPPDRAYRRRVFWAVLPLMLLCAAGLWELLGRFQELKALAETDLPAALRALRRLVAAASVANGAVSLLLCVWFGSLAYRTCTSERYPPPGTRVLRETRLRTGREAFRMAAAQAAVGLLVLSTNGVMWYLRRIVNSLQG